MNKQNPTKKEHYIPEFYLKNFYADDKKIAVYNYIYKTMSRKASSQVCYEEFLYETKWNTEKGDDILLCENIIEKSFFKRENEFTKTVNKIIEICKEKGNIGKLICSEKEKTIMAIFVANLYLRNPITLQYRFEELETSTNVDEKDEFLELYAPGISKATTELAQKIAWLADTRKDGIFDKTVNALKNLHMFFCMSCERNFIFSNFPVMIQTDKKNDFSYVHVPLSPNCLIVYANNEYAKSVRNKLVMIDDKNVDKINYMYITQKYAQIKYLFAKNIEDIEHVLKCNSKDMSF